jgi:hypothetical protein
MTVVIVSVLLEGVIASLSRCQEHVRGLGSEEM